VLALGAVSITAGMVHDTLSAAVVTSIDVTAKFVSSAVDQVIYDLTLRRVKGICLLIVSDIVF